MAFPLLVVAYRDYGQRLDRHQVTFDVAREEAVHRLEQALHPLCGQQRKETNGSTWRLRGFELQSSRPASRWILLCWQLINDETGYFSNLYEGVEHFVAIRCEVTKYTAQQCGCLIDCHDPGLVDDLSHLVQELRSFPRRKSWKGGTPESSTVADTPKRGPGRPLGTHNEVDDVTWERKADIVTAVIDDEGGSWIAAGARIERDWRTAQDMYYRRKGKRNPHRKQQDI